MQSAAARLALLLLLPLLVVVAVLWHWAATGTEWLDLRSTGVSGELLAGDSVGQTLTPRYDGLHALGVQIGTYGRVTSGTLTLRLTAAGDGRELAQASLPKSALVDNGVAWFQFAPLPAGSQGQPLRFTVSDPSGSVGQNAVTFYRNAHDPYPGGAALLHGQSEPSTDLVLGMRYQVTPFAVWGSQWAAWARSVPGPIRLLGTVAALGSAAGLIGLLLVLAVRAARPETARWAPGARAGIAGLALITLLGLAQGALWATFTPPWQGPDEPAHVTAAALLAKYGLNSPLVRDEGMRQAIFTSLDQRQFTRHVPWAPDPGGGAANFLNPPGMQSDTIWFETRQPKLYYALVTAAYRLGGRAPAQPDWPNVADVERLLYAGRLVSVLLQTVLVALAWLTGRALFGPGRAATGVGLSAALLPMPVFINVMVNNDVLADLAGALLALYAFRAVRRLRLRDVPLLVGGLALAVLSKATTLPAVALAVAAPVLGLWLRADLRAKLAVAGAAGLAVVLPLGWFVGTVDSTTYARSWTSGENLLPGGEQRWLSADAHDGQWTLAVPAGGHVLQRAPLPEGHGVLSATVAVWVRGAVTQPGDTPGQGTLFAGYDRVTPGSTQTAPAGAVWTRLAVQTAVPAGAQWVLVEFSTAGGGNPVEFDDASLTLQPTPAGSAPDTNWLDDPSFEFPARVPPAGLPGLKAGSTGYLTLAYVVDPIALDEFAGNEWSQFRTFWASFGWLAVELDGGVYRALAALGLLALAGSALALAGSGREPRAGATQREMAAALALILVVLAGAVVFSFVRTATGLKAYSNHEFPQGRYLFPLLVPILALLVLGARGWIAAIRRAAGDARAETVAAWGACWGVGALACFALLAFTTVLGFYYGLP